MKQIMPYLIDSHCHLNDLPIPQLLKENANRFTHQGRFTNLVILQTINKTVTNKNYVVTYAEFRKKTCVV